VAELPPGLVRVEAVTELTPGMAVYEVACDECGRDHWEFLVRMSVIDGFCPTHEPLGACPPQYSWEAVWCRDGEVCVARSLHEGRLYRLDKMKLLAHDLRVGWQEKAKA